MSVQLVKGKGSIRDQVSAEEWQARVETRCRAPGSCVLRRQRHDVQPFQLACAR